VQGEVRSGQASALVQPAALAVRGVGETLSLLGALAVVASAFLPWLQLSSGAFGRLTQTFGGASNAPIVPGSSAAAYVTLLGMYRWEVAVAVAAGAVSVWLLVRVGARSSPLGSTFLDGTAARWGLLVAAVAIGGVVAYSFAYRPHELLFDIFGITSVVHMASSDLTIVYGTYVGAGGGAALVVGAIVNLLSVGRS
jgi:hypothetical protein